jgi:hypothetical protein
MTAPRTSGSTRGTSDLEQRALDQMLRAASEGHVYPDMTYLLNEAVREAYKRGGQATAAELADAYSLYIIGDDDLDRFRDELTERIPPGWKPPPRPKAARRRGRS